MEQVPSTRSEVTGDQATRKPTTCRQLPIPYTVVSNVINGFRPVMNYDCFALSPLSPDIAASRPKALNRPATPIPPSPSRPAFRWPVKCPHDCSRDAGASPMMGRFLADQLESSGIPHSQQAVLSSPLENVAKTHRSSWPHQETVGKSLRKWRSHRPSYHFDGLTTTHGCDTFKPPVLSVAPPTKPSKAHGNTPPPPPMRARFGVDSRIARERNGTLSLKAVPFTHLAASAETREASDGQFGNPSFKKGMGIVSQQAGISQMQPGSSEAIPLIRIDFDPTPLSPPGAPKAERIPREARHVRSATIGKGLEASSVLRSPIQGHTSCHFTALPLTEVRETPLVDLQTEKPHVVRPVSVHLLRQVTAKAVIRRFAVIELPSEDISNSPLPAESESASRIARRSKRVSFASHEPQIIPRLTVIIPSDTDTSPVFPTVDADSDNDQTPTSTHRRRSLSTSPRRVRSPIIEALDLSPDGARLRSHSEAPHRWASGMSTDVTPTSAVVPCLLGFNLA
jgi:hypothetical protein